MNAADVVAMIQLLVENGIQVHVDGGWGVDALLGEQTRLHEDLDIAIAHQNAPLLRELLAACGYREIPRDDSWECNFVLQDDVGRTLDVHSYTFDAQGNHVFGVPYPAESLAGRGMIAGYPVACITPEWMVKFHSGYELDRNDYRDVLALCERFGIDLPAEFGQFQKCVPNGD